MTNVCLFLHMTWQKLLNLLTWAELGGSICCGRLCVIPPVYRWLNRFGCLESGLRWPGHVCSYLNVSAICRLTCLFSSCFRVPTVPVKNLNGSSPVHPALAGKHIDTSIFFFRFKNQFLRLWRGILQRLLYFPASLSQLLLDTVILSYRLWHLAPYLTSIYSKSPD